jgi:glyoxalase family protein
MTLSNPALNPVQGLHHITAMASDPLRNLQFYRDVLGQRFIKKTVNFDDPSTYHLYYADYRGTPGTVLTFFPWPHLKKGTRGTGEAGAFAYSISRNSLDYWRRRLIDHELEVTESERFAETVLAFSDPDGLVVELITNEGMDVDIWDDSPVPAEHQLRGFHSITMNVARADASAALLAEHLGLAAASQAEENGSTRYRYQLPSGQVVDVLEQPRALPARLGSGSIHHVAFRNTDDDEQMGYLRYLRGKGVNITPVQDRHYFHSIYFREPAGVLFELATDAPGFDIDEPLEKLGERLQLPTWYEPHRAEIEAHLPELDTVHV